MKYSIHINQKAILESGLDIGLIEAAILDCMVNFSHSAQCRKSFENAKVYYWFSYQIISKQLPILKISKDRVYRYVKALVDLHLLEPHPNNQRSGQSWFAFSEMATKLTYGENTEPTVKKPGGYGENTEPPTVKTPDNNNIIDNTIKINKRASPATALNIPFESFWDLYDKKRDRPACEKKWAALTDAERQAVITHLPAYVRSTPDKKFRRDPATYLNNRSWENEIISPMPMPTPVTPKPVYTPPKWKTGADWN